MASLFSSTSEAAAGKLRAQSDVQQLIAALANAVAAGQVREADAVYNKVATLSTTWEETRSAWYATPGLALQAYENVSAQAYAIGAELGARTGQNPVSKPPSAGMPWWGWPIAAVCVGIIIYAWRR